MMALMVLTADEELEAHEFLDLSLDMMELLDPDDERRREDLMLVKDKEWKRVFRIFADELWICRD